MKNERIKEDKLCERIVGVIFKSWNQVITFIKVRDISISFIFFGSVVKNGSIFTNTHIPNQVFYYIKINLRNFFEDLLLKILVQSTSTENTQNTKISYIV